MDFLFFGGFPYTVACEMAIFPISLRRKEKYCFSLLPTASAVCEFPRRYSGQQLLMELWPDPHREESDFYEIS